MGHTAAATSPLPPGEAPGFARRLAGARVLRFILEALVGCPGSCSGCGLVDKRAAGTGLWDRAMMDQVFALIRQRRAAWPGTGQTADVLKVNCVQGDFLALPDAAFDDLAYLVRGIEAAADLRHMAIAFTTTALGKDTRLAAACRRLLAIAADGRSRFSIEVVVDPLRIAHAPARRLLAHNVDVIQQAFGCPVLYTYQIGPTVAGSGLTGRDLVAAAVADGARLINLNMLPNTRTAPAFAAAWPEVMRLAREVYETWIERRDIYLIMAFFAATNARVHGDSEDLAMVRAIELERARNALYVAHDGALARRFTGVTEVVPPVPAYGFSGAHLSRGAEALADDIARTETEVLTELARPAVCAGCTERALCAASGGGVLMRQIGRRRLRESQPGACPLAWRDFLAQMVADDARLGFAEDYGINVV